MHTHTNTHTHTHACMYQSGEALEHARERLNQLRLDWEKEKAARNMKEIAAKVHRDTQSAKKDGSPVTGSPGFVSRDAGVPVKAGEKDEKKRSADESLVEDILKSTVA